MNYKLLDAVRLGRTNYFDIEYKDLILRYKEYEEGEIYLCSYCSKEIYGNSLIGTNITHQGIPENLKNHIEDPLFEIELELEMNNRTRSQKI